VRISVCARVSMCDAKKNSSEWERQWSVFMERRGSSVPTKMPVVAGVPFDPFAMFHEVLRNGGLRKVFLSGVCVCM